jgi:ribose transport system substrate-binding protein
MVSQRVDGIAVAAADRKALVTPIERAAAANIPVTVFDSGLDTTQYISYVATDNVEAGRVAARTLINLTGGKGKVGIMMHAPGSASTMDREKGFSEALAAEAPEMKIVASQYGMSDRSKARAGAENILTAHPDLTGMFASSEPSSVGASLAIQGRDMKDKVVLVAFDASDTMIEDLRTGAIDAMIVQDAYRMGFEAVKTLVDKLNGKTPPRRVDLHAARVQLKDLNEPEVKRLLNLK